MDEEKEEKKESEHQTTYGFAVLNSEAGPPSQAMPKKSLAAQLARKT